MARKSFLLRISPELFEEINSWAAEELRSVNGQIEYLLRDAMQARRNKHLAQNDDDEDTPTEP